MMDMGKYGRLLAVLVGALLVGAILWISVTRDEDSRRTIRITAFGDSLTQGYGLQPEESYPSLLETRLKSEGYDVVVVNAGIPGETSKDGYLRIEETVGQLPDLVLLGFGANDALQRIPVEETERNLRGMIERYRSARIPVVLLGMRSPLTGGLENAVRFRAMYPMLAEEYDTPLVPFMLEGVALRPELNLADGVHPNTEGYRVIVDENILPVVRGLIEEITRKPR